MDTWSAGTRKPPFPLGHLDRARYTLFAQNAQIEALFYDSGAPREQIEPSRTQAQVPQRRDVAEPFRDEPHAEAFPVDNAEDPATDTAG